MTPHLVRKCVVCGRRENKAELFRFVCKDARIVWDRSHSLGGRGAYCHPAMECVTGLKKPQLFERALRLGKGVWGHESLEAVINEVLSGGIAGGRIKNRVG